LAQAYNRHHKLVLRPEDIWLAIQCQFAFYVNKNSEELRTIFVAHEGKKELVITDGEANSQDIGIMSKKMVEKMKDHLNNEHLSEWILPNFSTTTNKDLIIFSVLMMGTLKEYFEYKFELCCGLPEVTLLGEVSDWTEILNRAVQLIKYELPGERYMAKWLDLLLPVLAKFVETASGSPDLNWWNKVCSEISGGSGPSYISGWVSVFTVFSNKGEWIANKFSDEWRDIKNNEWPLINTNDISNGYVSFKVKVNNDGVEFEAIMYSGIMSANIINNNTIIPKMDWAICRELTNEQVLRKKEVKPQKKFEPFPDIELNKKKLQLEKEKLERLLKRTQKLLDQFNK
jgi:hypothetical protein